MRGAPNPCSFGWISENTSVWCPGPQAMDKNHDGVLQPSEIRAYMKQAGYNRKEYKAFLKEHGESRCGERTRSLPDARLRHAARGSPSLGHLSPRSALP